MPFPLSTLFSRTARHGFSASSGLAPEQESTFMTANPSENKTPDPAAPGSTESAPASGGIKSKLTDAQKAMLASKSGGGAPAGWQSTGKGHKPTSASGKRAKTEKKVRW
jgi:hypothetical protein